jgi:hypothetical protein
MSWTGIVEACVAAVVMSNLTDWFFFGVLFHEQCNAFPEVWRLPAGSKDESKVVMRTAVVCTLTPLLFVLGCAYFNVTTAPPLAVAVLGIWAMTAVPHLFSNYLFMKLHPLMMAAHAMGWLARFAVSALAVAILIK